MAQAIVSYLPDMPPSITLRIRTCEDMGADLKPSAYLLAPPASRPMPHRYRLHDLLGAPASRLMPHSFCREYP